MFSTPSMSFFIFLLLYLVFALLYLTLGRPYLRKKKGKLSVDDEIPYAIIPMMALLFLVFLTDIIRYHFGTDVSLGEVGTMFKMTFDIMASAVYLGFILPHVFHFKYAEVRFTKPLTGHRAMFFIIVPLASVYFWSGKLAEVIFLLLI